MFSTRRSGAVPIQHTRFLPGTLENLLMTTRLAASIFILLMSIATAQAADDIVGPLRTQWGVTRDLVVNLVQIMPEEKYDYRPTPEIRSFRENVGHLILENYNFMSMVGAATYSTLPIVAKMRSCCRISGPVGRSGGTRPLTRRSSRR